MNGTPRLRSAYPLTPSTGSKAESHYDTPSMGRGVAAPLASLPTQTADQYNAPIIPFDIIDAPSQRMYVSAFYIVLILWRCYDYWRLVSNESDTLWLFVKWIVIDAVFLFGLPGLKIPWLEWSSSTMITLFLAHAFINGILMFRIAVCSSTVS